MSSLWQVMQIDITRAHKCWWTEQLCAVLKMYFLESDSDGVRWDEIIHRRDSHDQKDKHTVSKIQFSSLLWTRKHIYTHITITRWSLNFSNYIELINMIQFKPKESRSVTQVCLICCRFDLESAFTVLLALSATVWLPSVCLWVTMRDFSSWPHLCSLRVVTSHCPTRACRSAESSYDNTIRN